MKIGSLVIDDITVLAPIAGVTNLPFRLMVKKAGCGLVCSEMISSNGIVFGSEKTIKMLDSSPEEKPVSFQIFGYEPSIMADAAAEVEAKGADIIDINFGCSVKKIVKSGSGVALMKDRRRAADVLKAVRNSVKIPLTVKIRTGWAKSGEDAVETAEIAEDCGVDAIAVHPRTATQGFRGKADWTVISKIRENVSIPVVGNGDITEANDALSMIRQTGCDAVMIGRTAIGNPWIFSQVSALLSGKNPRPVMLSERFCAMKEYLETTVRYFGEKKGCLMMRSRLAWFVKGLPSNAVFRESIKRVASEDQAKDIIGSYYDMLLKKHPDL
jgi:nifR3 family TIM-barrel protein